MINNKTTNQITLDNFISRGKRNSFTLDNTNMFVISDGIGIPYTNIFREKYRSLILVHSSYIKLDDENYKKYAYRPKKLAYDIYGTTDLWYLIIWLNNLVSATQFNKRTLLLFNPESMDTLNLIVNLEANRLRENKEDPYEVRTKTPIIRR